MATVHLIIKGKVQGVFYRASAKEKANELNIKGWIKNTKTGDVEAIAQGDDEQVKKFIDWCRRGPSTAAVVEVIVTEKEKELLNDFSIKKNLDFFCVTCDLI